MSLLSLPFSPHSLFLVHSPLPFLRFESFLDFKYELEDSQFQYSLYVYIHIFFIALPDEGSQNVAKC